MTFGLLAPPAPTQRRRNEAVLAGRPMSDEEAETRTRLLEAFDGREFMDGDRRLRAQATVGPAADHGIEPWLWFDTPLGSIAAVVLRADGAPSAWPTRIVSLCVSAPLSAMGRLEFVIEALEADGPPWRPARFGPADGLCVRLDLEDDGGRVSHQLALRIPEAACGRLCVARMPDLSRLPPSVALPTRLVLAGPHISFVELSSLAIGDFVWLAGGDRCEASILLGAGFRAAGLFDPGSRQFLSAAPLQPDAGRSRETIMTVQSAEPPVAGLEPAVLSLEDIPVRLSFELGPWQARLADIVGLGPGSVLSALGEDAEPKIRITVEGRVVASGRLVVLGRRYGVLVDSTER